MERISTLVRRAALLIVVPTALAAQTDRRVQLRLDTAEAVAVLELLRDPASADAWTRLFASEGYRRLVAREAAMRRAFTDSAFVDFVRSDTLRARAGALRATLSAWERADLLAAAARAMAYLPAQARIVATVYPVIKPRTNTFVWETRGPNPAIFLYLDPAVTPEEFVNTVAHELHHIGYASVRGPADSLAALLPDRVRPVATWIGALGEGFAMLAAAGGPDVHPHAASPVDVRARWDADVARFNGDLRILDRFLGDILAGRYPTADSIQAVAAGFFGEQGPWYTVGWRVAVAIERAFGRDELIRCMTDPHRLLSTYNRAAAQSSPGRADRLAQWSAEVVEALAPRGR